jgi:DNA-binding transcriptional LysR family regulator
VRRGGHAESIPERAPVVRRRWTIEHGSAIGGHGQRPIAGGDWMTSMAADRSEISSLRDAVELRHLRYFVAVAEERSFGRAAQRLYMAQPPLSQQIAKLETLLGVALFTRTNRGVTLTAAGREMLPKARSALQAAQDATETARRAAQGERGVVRLAYNLTAGWEIVPAVLAAARRELPGIELVAHELWRGDVTGAGGAEAFDVGVGPVAERVPGLAYELLRVEPLMLAMSPRHPLGDAGTLPLGAFAGEAFATFGRAAPMFHDTVLRICRAAGFEPRLEEHTLLPPAGWRLLGGTTSVMVISRAAAPLAAAAGAATVTLAPPVPTQPLELFRRAPGASLATEHVVALARRLAAAHGWRTPPSDARPLARAA